MLGSLAPASCESILLYLVQARSTQGNIKVSADLPVSIKPETIQNSPLKPMRPHHVLKYSSKHIA